MTCTGPTAYGTLEFTTEFISEDPTDCDYKKCVIVWCYAYYGEQTSSLIGKSTKEEKRKIYCVNKDGKEEVIFDADAKK